ncbi:MAG: substrate-binding domain-containing protein [Colwellia sp.]
MKEIGYAPNVNTHALVTQKSTTIDVVIPELTDPFLRHLQMGWNLLHVKVILNKQLIEYNDAIAIGVISALEYNGYCVPHDISVLGFDDVLLSRNSRPKFSTFNYPIEVMAIQAANLTFKITFNKENNTSNLKYIPKLVKRESTSNNKD